MSAWRLGIAALCMLVVLCDGLTRANKAESSLEVDRLFDEYGAIRWEDEKARLDNFAIQITNNPDDIGYIFVYDGKNVCKGEAQARAIRAKRYIVEHRGVPWNRVIWRLDGYTRDFVITLQPAERGFPVPYPFMGYQEVTPQVHITRNCRQRMAQIKTSRWN